MCIHLLEYTHSASICKRTAECSAVSRMCLYAAVSSAGRFSGTESRGLCPAAPEVVYWILKQVQDDVRARHSGLAPESRGLVFPSFRARPGIQGFGVFPSFRARPGIQWSCLSVIPGSPRNPGFWCPASPEVVYWILDQVQDDGGGFGMTSAHVIPGSPRNPVGEAPVLGRHPVLLVCVREGSGLMAKTFALQFNGEQVKLLL